MRLGFIVPVFVILVGMMLFWMWYRRTMSDLSNDGSTRSIPGSRLTAERLRNLSNPPWRVVFEIESKLGAIDHVVVGPNGAVAIETLMMDRPAIDPTAADDPQRIASAAIARGDVDELTSVAGIPCNLHAKVYWGQPQDDLPAAIQVTHGQVAVVGQRLEEWLMSRPPGEFTPGQVDLAWQHVITGIGRPDPLS